MEFLDINLTRDSNLLLYAIQSPFYWRILKKTIGYSSRLLIILTKKIPETRKLESFLETKTRVQEDSSLCPETSTKNTVQEFYPWCRSTPAAAPGSPVSSPSGSARNSCSTCTTHRALLLFFRCQLLPVFRIRIHLVRIRIQHFFAEYWSGSGSNPDPIKSGSKVLMIKNLKKLTAEKKFESKTTIHLSLGLQKGRPSYRWSLQPSKKNA